MGRRVNSLLSGTSATAYVHRKVQRVLHSHACAAKALGRADLLPYHALPTAGETDPRLQPLPPDTLRLSLQHIRLRYHWAGAVATSSRRASAFQVTVAPKRVAKGSTGTHVKPCFRMAGGPET